MRLSVHLVAVALLFFGEVAHGGLANLIVNGNFEEPAVPVGGWTTFKAPEGFAGWKVASGGVDVTSMKYFASRSGRQSLDLNALEPGSVSQTVTTKKGQRYLLTFALAANPIWEQGVKVMEVKWNNQSLGKLEFDSRGNSAKRVDWKNVSCAVMGTGLDKLTFQSLSTGSAGTAIDKVSLTLLPASSEVGEKLSYTPNTTSSP